jgi:NAD-dependent deacetylase sirtuin 2
MSDAATSEKAREETRSTSPRASLAHGEEDGGENEREVAADARGETFREGARTSDEEKEEGEASGEDENGEDDAGDDTASSSSSEGYGFGRESPDMLALMARLAAQKLGTTTDAVTHAPIERALESFDLKGIAQYIRSGAAKNIVVMTGAGISVSAGIPDFRSESGLYARLGEYDLPYPQAIFELNYFRQKPGPFYKLAADLYPGLYAPTPTHHFIKLLHDKGLLLRCFTQNIDSLECAAGVPKEKVVAAHGNFDSARCLNGHGADVDEVEKACRAGTPLRCAACDEYIKPDIVFFGENLPRRFFECAQDDFELCDLLVVIGTSLVVHPFAGLIERPKEDVPRLLMNLERCGETPDSQVSRLYRLAGLGRGTGFDFNEDTNYRDALYLGRCDDGVAELCSMLGWEDDLSALVDACPIKSRLSRDET